jgi:predicted ATPase
MRRGNNIFSAENANEGILHILFYLALFISKKTPAIFGIDNIETALNPQLCRDLTKELAVLVKKNDKQALVTTHNPAILDGLDLHDDDQRLFVVYRNDHGHTVTKRIKLKPEAGGEKHKLSELWMRGHLGGLPRRF